MTPRFGIRDVQLLTGWSRRDARRLVRQMRHLPLEEQAWNIVEIRRTLLSPGMVFAAWDVARAGESGGVVTDGRQTALVDVRTRG